MVACLFVPRYFHRYRIAFLRNCHLIPFVVELSIILLPGHRFLSVWCQFFFLCIYVYVGHLFPYSSTIATQLSMNMAVCLKWLNGRLPQNLQDETSCVKASPLYMNASG